MIGFSGAKINIGLRIYEKRPDNYHNIFSLFYPIPLYDVLEIHEAPHFQYTQQGLPIPDKVQENLCYKAWHLLYTQYHIPPVHIYHQKNIPMGAGLGGGSANATCIIQLLIRYFKLSLSLSEQYSLAKKLSADSPFFIENKAAWVCGIGDEITHTDFHLNTFQIVLCLPQQISISSKWAYDQVYPRSLSLKEKEKYQELISTRPPQEWAIDIVNDFEQVIFTHYPHLRDIKNKLYSAGALFASMTGSGAAFFGIFEKRNSPLKKTFPNCDIYYL